MDRSIDAQHRLAEPKPPRDDPRGAGYMAWSVVRRSWLWWRLVYLSILLGCVVAARTLDPLWFGAAGSWVIAGSTAWIFGLLTEREASVRIARHDASALPAVGGWRLCRPIAELPALELLLLDLILTLHDRARLVRRAIRGHRHGALRVTYRIGLRDLAREWARQRGIPVRRADALMRELAERGLVVRVRINQAAAYRLADRSGAEALRRLEAGGQPLVVWELGRDPRACGWR